MATLLIDKFFIIANDSITSNSSCNYLILPTTVGITTAGQIIFTTDSNDPGFCLTVTGSDGKGKLSIGGNFQQDGSIVEVSFQDKKDGETPFPEWTAHISGEYNPSVKPTICRLPLHKGGL